MNFAPARNYKPVLIIFFIAISFSSFYKPVHASHYDAQALNQYLTPYNQALYSIIHEEFEQLRKKINHAEVDRLTREIEKQQELAPDNTQMIANLQNQLDEILRVFLTWHGEATEAGSSAPTIYKILRNIFEETAVKSNIQMPDIALHLTPSNNTLNSDALSAHAVLYFYHKFVDLGEEIFKLFLWNKQPKELLTAILAHEFGHIKFDHGASLQNEYDADAFAVSILEQPHNLIKALDMTMLENVLNHVIKYHTTYPISRITEISRILANYIADTVPQLGALGKTTTNESFSHILYTIVLQANLNSANTINTHSIVYDLAHRITQVCRNNILTETPDQEQSNTPENYPGPLDRRCHIENCIFAQKHSTNHA